jgi:hypothetical protein
MLQGDPYCCVFTVPVKLTGPATGFISTKDALKHWKMWVHVVPTGQDWFFELDKNDELPEPKVGLCVTRGWPNSPAKQNTILDNGSFVGITLFPIERIQKEGMFKREFSIQVLISLCL